MKKCICINSISITTNFDKCCDVDRERKLLMMYNMCQGVVWKIELTLKEWQKINEKAYFSTFKIYKQNDMSTRFVFWNMKDFSAEIGLVSIKVPKIRFLSKTKRNDLFIKSFLLFNCKTNLKQCFVLSCSF